MRGRNGLIAVVMIVATAAGCRKTSVPALAPMNAVDVADAADKLIGRDVIVDVMDTELKDGDMLLLCSDGLTGMLEDQQIRDLVHEHREDLKAACKALIDTANAHGGDDNITVILVRYRDAGVAPESDPASTLDLRK